MDKNKKFELETNRTKILIESFYPEWDFKTCYTQKVSFTQNTVGPDTQNDIGLTIEEVKFIVKSFNEILEYYKKTEDKLPGSVVKIINGICKGCNGTIIETEDAYDDNWLYNEGKPDNKELVVYVKSEQFLGNCFVNYEDVEIITEQAI